MTLQVKIYTPERVVEKSSFDELILPTNSGQMGVLTNHAPLTTGLDVGVMLARQGDQWRSFALSGGFAYIAKNDVQVLVNEAEDAATIEIGEAEAAYEKALRTYEETKDEVKKISANAVLKRARTRFQAAKSLASRT